MFREVPADRVLQVYLSESFSKKKAKELSFDGMPVEILSDTVFSYVSDTKTPQGILCVVRQMEYTQETVLAGDSPYLLILHNLQDPGNMGTILRTAEGAGVTGIIMSSDCVDVYNPKVIRSTMGSIYRMPFLYVDDINQAIETVQKKGICVYAAHLDGKNAYDKENYKKGTAFLIGNEGNGLPKEVADKADTWIRIPMHGQVESLNAAIAATILMFEVCRQRR